MTYYERSAELGNSNALFALGCCYRDGEGVPKDFTKAIEYYERSAKLGNSTAKKKLLNLQ